MYVILHRHSAPTACLIALHLPNPAHKPPTYQQSVTHTCRINLFIGLAANRLQLVHVNNGLANAWWGELYLWERHLGP